eukprot:m.173761 g.173761  ORF g.173761 m.173761 type:complete len:122 (+) comp14587_c0_seq6:1992-2357(+)
MPLPIQIFEVSDVVLKDSESETGARNVRHLCAAAMSKTAGFQDVQGLLDYIMKMVEVSFRVPAQEGGKAYQLVPSTGMDVTMSAVYCRCTTRCPSHSVVAPTPFPSPSDCIFGVGRPCLLC